MPRYRLVESATRIPVPGGKLIEELFGRVNTESDGFSLARMVAPPGWSEPAQTPEFGELTIMVRGTLQIVVHAATEDAPQPAPEPEEQPQQEPEPGADRELFTLEAGQAFWIEPGVKVRYSNPFPDECEYYAICIPAFHPDRAHRDE